MKGATMNTVIGIDLGTTRSEVAYVEYDHATIIPNQEGDRITPSVLLIRYSDKGEREVIVGKRAKHAAVAEAENVARLIKRHMCEKDYVWIDGKEKEYTPQELSALILKKLKQDAEAHLGNEVTEAVITVPYYFGDLERSRTRQAGEIAGLNVLRILNEPEAAAIAYGLGKTGQPMTLLVYDLGGGTFDVTIMRVDSDGSIIGITSNGNKFLGGANFDGDTVSYFVDEFKKVHELDPLKDLATHQDFLEKAEQAKEDLSYDQKVSVSLSCGGKSLTVELTREKLEEIIVPWIDTTITIVKDSLADAWKKMDNITDEEFEKVKASEDKWNEVINQQWTKIDRILLVGGSTRSPLVSRKLRDEIRKAIAGTGKSDEEIMKEVDRKFASGVNPDEIVALGAALFASDLKKIKGLPSPIKSITAHSLGVKAKDPVRNKYINDKLILKDTEIPAKKVSMYTTEADNASTIQIILLQGEEEDPEYCTVVGEKDGYVLSGIPPMKANEPQIEVTMEYDLENIIHLTARELKSGQTMNVEVKYPELLTSEEVRKKKEELLSLPVR
jgi:molecular chaperone DnaK